MSAMASVAERADLFTTDDLDAMPADGRRYELIDGQLLVSPAPAVPHQRVAYVLFGILEAACPDDMLVIGAPFAVRPDRHNELQPDVLVGRFDDLVPGGVPGKRLTTAPLLAVEVLSPSTRLSDRTLKRAAYARLGAASFWLVDPDVDRPSLTAFVLDGDDYRQIAEVSGDEPFVAQHPFEVTIVPADLVRRLRRRK